MRTQEGKFAIYGIEPIEGEIRIVCYIHLTHKSAKRSMPQKYYKEKWQAEQMLQKILRTPTYSHRSNYFISNQKQELDGVINFKRKLKPPF